MFCKILRVSYNIAQIKTLNCMTNPNSNESDSKAPTMGAPGASLLPNQAPAIIPLMPPLDLRSIREGLAISPTTPEDWAALGALVDSSRLAVRSLFTRVTRILHLRPSPPSRPQS